MRKTADRLRAELSSRGGETLVETVISLLIFTVVMLAVTYMLTTSLRLVNKAQETARLLQDRDNAVAAGDYTGSAGTVAFTIDALGVTSSHGAVVKSENGICAFRPETEAAP